MSPSRLIFATLSLTTVLLFVGGSIFAANTTREDDGQDSLYKYLAVFTEVLGLVKRAYVDETETEALMSGAFEGTVDALDPFSLYIPAAYVPDYLAAREIGLGRSGLLVLKERGVAYAISIVEGSPADQIDLERGDVISAIRGQATREMPLFELQAILAGPAGTEIEIERIRLGQSQTVTLKLAAYTAPGVTLQEKEGMAVLRPTGIDAQTSNDIETILETLSSSLPMIPKLADRNRLLLDLRGLAAGDAEAAYRVAGRFVRGELGALTARDKELQAFNVDAEPLWRGERLVVLIDRGTQGAAEILATILHQNADAKLVGEHSFGHSGRQSLVELSDGGRLQITDAFFTGPDRQPINKGLVPDVAVRLYTFDLEDGTRDPILERGLEVLRDDEEVEKKKAA